MLDTRRFGTGLLVALLSSCLLPGQVAMAQNGDIAFQAVVGQPLGLPQLPPQGAWGEVINVTSRWIVVQNHSGQQFPIAIDDIQEFLIRWPTSIERPERTIPGRGRGPGRGVERRPGRTTSMSSTDPIERWLLPPTTACCPITWW